MLVIATIWLMAILAAVVQATVVTIVATIAVVIPDSCRGFAQQQMVHWDRYQVWNPDHSGSCLVPAA